MNVLINKARKQASVAQDGLRRMDEIDSIKELDSQKARTLQGEISIALTLFSQAIKEIDQLSSREMDASKRIQHKDTIRELQGQHLELKTHFEKLKIQYTQRSQDLTRKALLHPVNDSNADNSRKTLYDNSTGEDKSFAPLTERQRFNPDRVIDHASTSLDQYIQMGTATLSDLQQQKSLLKGTHRRILDVANVLGLSQSVIRWIDLRNRQDQYVFYLGITITCIIIVWIFYYIL